MLTLVKNLAVVVAGLAASGAATAGEYGPQYKKVTVYQTVTYTKTVEVPYQKAVTKYDHCGKPYNVTVTCYRNVEITATKQVPVTKYVKVCD
jgi:hypothetical protein